MNRWVTVLVTAAVGSAVLAGCGADSPYCAAVKDNEPALKTFGTAKTTAAFRAEAKAVRAIAGTKPDKVADDWAEVASAMRAVTAAQREAGVTFEDLADPAQRAEVSQDDIASIDKAYTAFNETAKQRTAVVADVKQTCDVSLAPDKEK